MENLEHTDPIKANNDDDFYKWNAKYKNNIIAIDSIILIMI